jgi:rare lipoprotein A
MFVIAVLLAGSAACDAHDLWKQNPWKHHRHSFAWNVHRQGSVVQHRETTQLSAKRNVATDPVQPIIDFFQKGLASIWAGGSASDGKHVRPTDVVCAHRTLPLGTVVRATDERTKKSILVIVRDRGPYKRGRVVDLTPTAASALGFGSHAGAARVVLNIVGPRYAPAQVIYD